MPNLKDVLLRVKDILSTEVGNRKVFDKDVAEALNINQITLATMKSRNKIPYQEILDFCAKRKISINWLFYNQIVESLKEETEKFARIRYFKDIYASAGGGAENHEIDEEFLSVDEMMLSHMGIHGNVKKIEAINVMGDSMEPTLSDGNVVFIDRDQTSVSRGGIFVVSTPGGLFIKRLQLKSNGMIDLISDNSAYGPESVISSSVEIVGKVIGAVSEVG